MYPTLPYIFPGDDPFNLHTLKKFTGMKIGRLIGDTVETQEHVHTAGDCAKLCLDLPEHSCLSINYDSGKSGLCELVKSIEGHDNIVAKVSIYFLLKYLRYI